MSRSLGRSLSRAAAILPAWAALGFAALPAAARELPVQADTLNVAPDAQLYCLGRAFVLPSTLVLRAGSDTLVADDDYVLDPESGCVTFLDLAILDRGTLIATYRALPLDLRPVWRLREDPRLVAGGGTAPPPDGEAQVRPFTSDAEAEGLDVSGSKTFGIEVGNRRDLRLRQSLDLRLSGKVGRNVDLLAILSDQDVPFQPEGNTAELEELDKVLVELRGPRAAVSLGDVEMANRGTRFLEVERRLEGLRGETRWGNAWTRGVLAAAKGEYRSLDLFGEDGKQGPYRLADRTGGEGIALVAGSERVWLDGELLRRGQEEDYVIDYAVGEITFTSRRTITANSRITVDYEYSTGRYRRRVAFSGSEGLSLGRAGRITAAVFREADDADDPVGGELTERERAELAALGDSAQVGGGTVYVGPGRDGTYDLLVDSQTGREIFVFVGAAGEYRVVFVDVGEDRGDYEVDAELSSPGRTVYRFVGDGRGDFVVRRDLPAPETRTVVDLRWELAGRGGRLAAEGAFSETDRNTLSPLDDGDNRGGAVWVEGKADTLRLGGGWTASPDVRYRRTERDFSAPGRVRESFYGRDWNLVGTEAIRAEDLKEAGLDLAWRGRFRLRTDAGRLAVADTFLAVRARQEAAWDDAWVRARLSRLDLREDGGEAADGGLERTVADVRLVRWKIQPRGRVYRETRRRPGAGAGERFREWEAALRFPVPLGTFSAEAGLGRRMDDARDSTAAPWAGERDAERIFMSIDGNYRSLSLITRYEERRVDTPDRGRETRSLGRLDLRHDALRGAWNAVTTLDVGTVGLRRRPKLIEPDSTGYFDEFGNYVGPGGGFDVRYDSLGVEVLTARVDLSARVRWSPRGSEEGLPEILRRVAWEGFVNLSEASTLPLGTLRYLVSPGSYMDRQTTLEGRVRARQTLDLFPNARAAGLRLRQETDRRMVRNQETAAGSLLETGGETLLAATLRAAPAPGWTAELEGSRGRRTEEVETSADRRFELATRLLAATLRAGKRLGGGGGSLRLSGEFTFSTETGDDRRAEGWTARPRLQWTLSGAGRVDARAAYTRLNASRGFTALRGPGAPTLTGGWRLDVAGEVRLRRGVTATATIGVDDPADFDAVTEGRLEVRGTF